MPRAPRPDPTLQALRRRMDRLNRRLRDLLQERARLALAIGRHKHARGERLADPARERAMLAAILRDPPPGFPQATLRALWRAVFRASRALLQRRLRGG